MISTELKARVQRHVDVLRERNPLLRRAREGSLTSQQFGDYLNNLMYFFRHTVIHLAIARDRARELGCEGVVPFFEEKIGEETGHDRWALNDLRRSGKLQDDVDLSRVAPATHRILAYSVDLIERDPELFLAYMFYHEYATVIGGPELLADLEMHCGIPRDRVSAIAFHVDLDKHHVDEDLAEIEKVVERSPGKASQLLEVLDRTAQLADEFYAGMVGLYYGPVEIRGRAKTPARAHPLHPSGSTSREERASSAGS